jgi:hypothetical protein
VLGGCNDSDCEAAVCEIRPGCCNGGSIGEWSASCVQIAEETCYRYVLSEESTLQDDLVSDLYLFIYLFWPVLEPTPILKTIVSKRASFQAVQTVYV